MTAGASTSHRAELAERRAHHALGGAGPPLDHGHGGAGVSSARHELVGDGGARGHPHEHDEGAPGPGQRVPVHGAGRADGGAHPAGHHRDRRGQTALRHRDAGHGRHAESGRHAGHDLPVDARVAQDLDLLAAAAEHEGISALEPDHDPLAAPVPDQQAGDLVLAVCSRRVRLLAHVHHHRVRGCQVEDGPADQPIVQDDVGPGQQLRAAPGEQSGIARSGAHQVDGHASSNPSMTRAAAVDQQSAGDRRAHQLGLVPGLVRAHHGSPVAAGDQAPHPHGAAGFAERFGPGGDGRRAAPAELGQYGALGAEGAVRGRVVERREQPPRLAVRGAALHGEGALPGLGQHVDRVEHVGQAARPTQAVHGRHRDDDGVDLVGLADRHAPGHVAAHVGEDQVRPEPGQLGAPARRSGADDTTRGKVGQRAADQTVARVGSRRHRRHHEVRVHGGGEVLGGVHRGVGAPVAQRRLHLAHEDALAADEVERRRRVLVPAGAHDDDLDLEARMGRRQRVGDRLGLVPGERRAAGGQAERSHVVSVPWPGRGERPATSPPVPVRRRRRGGPVATGRRGCGGPRRGVRPEACRPSPSTRRWARAASSPWRRGRRGRPAPTPTR